MYTTRFYKHTILFFTLLISCNSLVYGVKTNSTNSNPVSSFVIHVAEEKKKETIKNQLQQALLNGDHQKAYLSYWMLAKTDEESAIDAVEKTLDKVLAPSCYSMEQLYDVPQIREDSKKELNLFTIIPQKFLLTVVDKEKASNDEYEFFNVFANHLAQKIYKEIKERYTKKTLFDEGVERNYSPTTLQLAHAIDEMKIEEINNDLYTALKESVGSPSSTHSSKASLKLLPS